MEETLKQNNPKTYGNNLYPVRFLTRYVILSIFGLKCSSAFYLMIENYYRYLEIHTTPSSFMEKMYLNFILERVNAMLMT